MRSKTVMLLVASAAVLAFAAACGDADPGTLGTANQGATSPDKTPPSGAATPAAPSGPTGPATDASAGGNHAPDAAPVFDPATCECFPNTTRWCDPADGVSWGKEQCGAGGTWGACAVVPDAPSGCDGQPFNELCCATGTACCESKGDVVDPNGNGSGGADGTPPVTPGADAGGFDGSPSVGACNQIACPAAIVQSGPGGLGRK